MEPALTSARTSHQRSNAEWLAALSGCEAERHRALEDLRGHLLRGVLVYLRGRRSDLQNPGRDELMQFAEECAAEAVVAVQERLDAFRGDSRFTVWASRFVIARAAAKLHNRVPVAGSRDRSTDVELKLPGAALADVLIRPGVHVARGELAEALGRLMPEVLSERQRSAVMLQLQGVPLDVIAEQLNVNRKALHRLLHDARWRLKRALLDDHRLREVLSEPA